MELEFVDSGREPDPIKVTEPAKDGPSQQASSYVSFRLKGADNSFANGIRRVLLAEIPTLAITIIELEINTSVFHDEFITHRLGLIPIKSPFEIVDSFPTPQSCACGQEFLERGNVSYRMGCDACQIRCSFDVMCPKDAESFEFTSNHIKSSDPRFEMAVGEGSAIYLAKLGRGQRIRGVAYVKKGMAKQHSRHMAVGTVSYAYDAEIKLNQTGLGDLSEEHRRLWVQRCPARVFDLVDGIVTLPRIDKCIMCRECLATETPFDDLPAPLVSVRNKRTDNGGYSILFKVESVGQLDAVELVRVAMIIMRRKMLAVKEDLAKARGGLIGVGGAATGGAAAAAGSSAAGGRLGADGGLPGPQNPIASSAPVANHLLSDEQDLLQMAENPQKWG